ILRGTRAWPATLAGHITDKEMRLSLADRGGRVINFARISTRSAFFPGTYYRDMAPGTSSHPERAQWSLGPRSERIGRPCGSGRTGPGARPPARLWPDLSDNHTACGFPPSKCLE